MANTLTNVIPQILAQGLLALRSRVVMPRLVNRDYERDAREKGDTIDVTIPSAVVANDVVPAATSQAVTDISPTKVQIALSNWKEAAFTMSDKEIAEAMSGTLPMQASEAVNALARVINASVLAEYVDVYGFAGAAGTNPFATDTSGVTSARKVLNLQLAPLADRRLVLDPDAEASALDLRAFQDASFRADAMGIIEGQIGRKFGFDVFMDQQIPTHTAGTLSDGSNHRALINDAAVAIGQTSVDMDSTTLTGTVVVGDIFTVAGDSQQYVVTAGATAAANAINVSFDPPAKVAWANDAQVDFVDTHVVNLAFHRDAFALASRPLSDDGLASGRIASVTDPVSGLSLRLEVSREHKRTRWSYDVLWGTQCVRPALAARLLG